LKNRHAVVVLHATAGALVSADISALAAAIVSSYSAAFAGVFLAFFVILLHGVGVSDINNITWKSMV
jgi:hypothetical protein